MLQIYQDFPGTLVFFFWLLHNKTNKTKLWKERKKKHCARLSSSMFFSTSMWRINWNWCFYDETIFYLLSCAFVQVMMSRLGAQRIGMEGMEKEVAARVRSAVVLWHYIFFHPWNGHTAWRLHTTVLVQLYQLRARRFCGWDARNNKLGPTVLGGWVYIWLDTTDTFIGKCSWLATRFSRKCPYL